MRILITGGSGYIGSALVYKLLQDDNIEKVIIYDSLVANRCNLLFDKALQNKKFEFIQGDILDTKSLEKIIENVDTVCHLAARVVMPLSNFGAHQFEQVNTWGTAELSYLIEKSHSVKRVIYLSSSAVYGYATKPLGETDVPNPVSHYAKSKLLAEKYIERLKKDKEVIILRSGNVFGKSISIRLDSIINSILFDIIYKGKVSIEGTGEQIYSFISLNGIVDLLYKLSIHNKVTNDIIQNAILWNLSMNDILNQIRNFIPNFDTIYVAKNSEIKHIMGQPNEELNSIINKIHHNFKLELEDFISLFSKKV